MSPENGVTRIHPVDRAVAGTIKAGVTVSSFSQCVADLIINSVEAGSSAISVDVKCPELSCTVADNGMGMISEDLKFVGLPYHSSKWGATHQGNTIASIGAIAMVSIASVSDKTEYATRIHRGTRIDPYKVNSCSVSRGTTVGVKGLFANMPVRSRFESSQPLKAHLLNLKKILLPYFVARQFELTISSDDIVHIHHSTSECTFLLPRIKSTLETMTGSSLSGRAATIAFEESIATGVLTLADLGTKNSARYILANNVLTEDPIIYKLVDNMLERWGFSPKKKREIGGDFVRRCPVYIICIDELANPTDRTTLESLILNSLANALKNNGYEPPLSKPEKPYPRHFHYSNSKYFNPPTVPAENPTNVKASSLQDVRVISQVANKFVLVNLRNELDETYLSVIDQHAADERIRCERITADFIKCGRGPVALDSSISLEVPEGLDPIELQPYLSQWGIKYTVDSHMHVTHLPAIICDCEDERLISGVVIGHLRHIYDGAIGRTLINSDVPWEAAVNFCPKGLIEVINSLSCRHAIKFGDKLSLSECHTLIRQLSTCKYPFQCAHGRPSLAPLVNLSIIP